MINISNPYTGLLSIIQQQGRKYNPPTIGIGKVMQSEPLQIKTGEMVLEQEDILISSTLVDSNNRPNNLK